MQLSGNIKHIRSYAEADAFFNTEPARTGRRCKIGEEVAYKENGHNGSKVITHVWEANERPLNTGNKYLGYTRMIREDDGSYAMRYHSTDVVTYHPDGTLLVDPYASLSTNTFFGCVAPGCLMPSFAPDLLLGVRPPGVRFENRWDGEWRIYQLASRTRLVPDGDSYRIEPGPDAWSSPLSWDWPTVDRQRARAAMEPYQLRRLEGFLITTLNMGVDQPYSHRWLESELRAIAADPTRWIELARNRAYLPDVKDQRNSWGNNGDNSPTAKAKRLVRRLRIHLLRAHGCYVVEQLPYLVGWRQVARHKTVMKQYESGGF